MKQENWIKWKKENEKCLPETSRAFLKDAKLESVNAKEVVFSLRNQKVVFKKLSETSWLSPSTLFVPYGSLTSLFQGFNLLLNENM